MQIETVDATLGALVSNIDLRNLTDDQFQAILDLWHERGVVVFKDQHLTDDEQINFSARFGRFEKGLTQSTNKLASISNVSADGTVAPPDSLQVRFHEGNTYWHSDSSYKRVGAKASILAARVVPDAGGETEWADMRAAWDELEPDMQQYLDGKIAVHSYVYSHGWHGGLEIISEGDLRHLPPIEHAVVKVHPVTGRKNLFVGRHASCILGEDEEKSRTLLKKLTADGAQSPRLWCHQWQVGDIGIWDNRCVLHRGHHWPEGQARTMVRSTIAGDDANNEWAMSD
jgi:alpha-ketoglutarate-dependent taurine dioxygenase